MAPMTPLFIHPHTLWATIRKKTEGCYYEAECETILILSLDLQAYSMFGIVVTSFWYIVKAASEHSPHTHAFLRTVKVAIIL